MNEQLILFGEQVTAKKKTRAEIFNDYDGFTEKFRPKKTTDDCYTPPAVYDAVLGWLMENTDIAGREIVRPFYPGEDYEHHPYPVGCVVVDNPPFSIYARVIRFYAAREIPFFLFAPALTHAISGLRGVTYLTTMSEITYENGAVVRTSFTTNLFPGVALWTCPELARRIQEAQPKEDKSKQQILYPDTVITPALMGKYTARGVDFKVMETDCYPVNNLDSLKRKGKSVFGIGFLLSERAAAERAAAERKAAERKATCTIELSAREMEIVRSLGK